MENNVEITKSSTDIFSATHASNLLTNIKISYYDNPEAIHLFCPTYDKKSKALHNMSQCPSRRSLVL